MKVRFLGTAAAEGWPGMYCNCENCMRARKAGGKNIRTRSQTLVNDELLIDYPADTYAHVIQNNLNLSAVRYCLITHSHFDHFMPGELLYHNEWAFAHNMTETKMDLYGNERIVELWDNLCKIYPNENLNLGITFHVMKAYETYQLGKYRVTPLPAVHEPAEHAFVYLVNDSEHTLLYLLDTAYPLQEVREWLAKENVCADMIVYDCTMGMSQSCSSHMNFEDTVRLHKEFLALGVASEKTIPVINHFSHNGQLIYDEIVEVADKENMVTAWDGMLLEV